MRHVGGFLSMQQSMQQQAWDALRVYAFIVPGDAVEPGCVRCGCLDRARRPVGGVRRFAMLPGVAPLHAAPRSPFDRGCARRLRSGGAWMLRAARYCASEPTPCPRRMVQCRQLTVDMVLLEKYVCAAGQGRCDSVVSRGVGGSITNAHEDATEDHKLRVRRGYGE